MCSLSCLMFLSSNEISKAEHRRRLIRFNRHRNRKFKPNALRVRQNIDSNFKVYIFQSR